MRNFKFFLMASIFVLIAAASSFACTCAPSQSATEELKRAAAVFAGRVLEVKRHKRPANLFADVEVIFVVDRDWKGVEGTTVSVFTGSWSASCGYGFKAGRTYLVYAYENTERRLVTGICSRTTRLKNAREDLKQIGPGRDRRNGSD